MNLSRSDSSAADSTRFLFFTGKGGVGGTLLGCATALNQAEAAQEYEHIVFDMAPTGHTLRRADRA